ncbi:NADH dehydrogenase subunit 5 (mitochondrion) [Pyxicephalus adspersus]|uniref:NADH-ubiquinone oxidoreductase chain 5 n=1 Tax=Pyxicephalus adspersus TaxID=30357 RepID=A0A5B8GCE9_PYXAD|nr:NADH dehydrogenase subunit 5 [Pyxicephalus adspersus]QDW76112.1 NADH dehydrogenase subunit 5 [Pyxicephalus adspersus]
MAHNPLLSFFCATASLIAIILPFLNLNSKPFFVNAKNAIQTAFLISLPPLFYLGFLNSSTSTSHWHWIDLGPMNINLSLQFDLYPTIFMPIAFFVTWSILEFSIWYMHSDPNINLFFKYLLIFLLAMIILVCAGNLFMLFIGWEGVGIMSFLLIGWYHARSNAAAAALQAVLYNRIGDIGFMLAFCWLLNNMSSTNIEFISTQEPPTIVAMGLIAAAAAKSAQFSLHPWLASAMEGPTPVSALLHSSTMVVAGIYLLIRIHPMIASNQTALTTCLCLGAISTAFAATCALTQNDIKKIIAFSTSSQLGLMMVAIGINFPHLAFFHICTHAFFKAMLFLCSGIIIHNLNDDQDIRKMGGLQYSLPITTSCLSIGSFALMGTPFLAGFFSKDAIIEAMNTSFINSTALLLTLVATTFTAIYSLRLIFFATLNFSRSNPTNLFNENNPLVINPIFRLAIGSIIAGLIIYEILLPNNLMTLTMPTYIKLSALLITVTALITAFDLTKTNWSSPPTKVTVTKTLDPMFYNYIIHRTLVGATLNSAGMIITHLLETVFLHKVGPDLVKISQLPPINAARTAQKGLIKLYLSSSLITFTLTILILQLM